MNNYVNKQDNLDEMDKFLETYNIPKLNQEKSRYLNRQITASEIEALVKKLPKNKPLGQMAPWVYFTKQSEKS